MDSEQPLNAAALLLARGRPGDTALKCGPARITFGELRTAVAQAAAGWIDCGVESGEVVLVRLPWGIAQATAFLGAVWAGAVPVPLPRTCPIHCGNPWDEQAPVRFILDSSRTGYATAWRDSVITLAEWEACVHDAGTARPVARSANAPACWTQPRRSDGSGARVVRHGFASQDSAPAPAAPVPAGSALGMLRVLRRGGTAILVESAQIRLRAEMAAEPA